jgi:TonB-dependent starch-binding outer membrane protein SusC
MKPFLLPQQRKLKAFWIMIFCIMLALQAHAQRKTISGMVKDTDGLLMPGVSIVEKGTTNGTTTDANGKYSLSVGPNATMMYSFIGMAPQEIIVGNQTAIDVVLVADISELDEVVVIGYGTVKKSDLTGSVVSVTGGDLRKVPVASVAESLTGRMAGVQVSTAEGSPDAEVKVRIRGGGSITQDNSPLYIVDGFPVNSIADIAPSDIESINVLKDASSTAIYGSRGANGVVIITTRSGAQGKVSVSYNTFFGAKLLAKQLDFLAPEDYVKWQYEYAILDNEPGELESYEKFFGTYQDMDFYSGLKANNWLEQAYGRSGNVFSHDLNVRGGSDKTSYSVNFAQYDEDAIMVGSDFKRNNVTLKLNSKPVEKVELAFSLRYSNTKINGGGTNEQNEISSADSRLKQILYPPLPISGLTSDDTNEEIASYLINPLVGIADNDRYQERRNYNMAGSFAWTIIDNLQFKTDVGLDNQRNGDDRFYGRSTYYVQNIPASENQGRPAVVLADRDQIRLRNTNTLNYNFKKLLSEKHSLNVMLGHEVIQTETRQISSTIHGYPTLFTSDEAFKLTTQGKAQSVNNFLGADDKLLSFFGRANYELNGKYLLSATFRADGSSKFIDDNAWGYFPSAAAAWKISEEQFMDGFSGWLDQLKVRASYGTAGNNNIPVGQTTQFYESSTNTWINGFDSYWSPSKTMANPDLQWETTVTRNFGLDFTVLQSRLSGSVETYLNTTKDLLLEFPTPGTGYSTQFRNLGNTENRGVEFSLNYVALESENYGLNFSVNMSFNRGKITSLGSMDNFGYNTNWASTEIGIDYLVERGRPVGIISGYQSDGRYEVSDFEGYNADTDMWTLKSGVPGGTLLGDPRPGLMKLKDITGDGLVNQDDQTMIGNANPKHVGGFILNGYAYGFDLTAAFSWSFGNDIYNANKIEYTSSTPRFQYRNLSSMMADGERWTNIDPATGQLVTDPTALANLNANTTMWSPYMSRYALTDWAVEDGSFLRLNTLTLGYSVPASLLAKVKIQSLRLYATGYNVFVLTNYSGFDPEVSTRRRTNLSPGVDYSAYPRSRQLVFGLSLNF